MKRRFRTPMLLIVSLALFAVGWSSPAPQSGLAYPVNMTLADGRLFVSDQYLGVFVYDVGDPAAPTPVTTIPLKGNRGTAVKDGIVYANEDNALHVLRIVGNSYETVMTLQPEYDVPGGGDGGWLEPGVIQERNGLGCACGQHLELASPLGPASVGSSFATFALVDDFLYRIDYATLVIYDVAVADKPKELKRVDIGWEIETIYPTDNFLLLGGNRGMYIYDRRSDPAAPHEIARIEHVRACDPVVVSGPVAYVTLRGGSVCGNAPDELLCVSMTDPDQPTVIARKELATPFGLAVSEPFLYVSNGLRGYTLLDVARPASPLPIAQWTDWGTKDFIWSGTTLYVLGFDGLRFFDVSDPRSPKLLAMLGPGAS